MNRFPIRSKVRWIVAMAMPPLVWLALAAAVRPENGPRPWPRAILEGLIEDALLLETVLVIVGVPVAAVWLTALARPGRVDDVQDGSPGVGQERAVPALLILVLCFVLSAAVTSWAASGWSSEAVRRLAPPHLTLAAAALALAGVGAWCGRMFRHPLDAVACSLAVSLIATSAILVGGPAVAVAPRPIVAAGLLVSPLVTIAAAAGVDLFRTDVLYQVSPLAHVRLEYPAWQAAAGLYFLVALVCFGGAARVVRSQTDHRTHSD